MLTTTGNLKTLIGQTATILIEHHTAKGDPRMNIAQVIKELRIAADRGRWVSLRMTDESRSEGVAEEVTNDMMVLLRREDGLEYVPIAYIVDISVRLTLTDR